TSIEGLSRRFDQTSLLQRVHGHRLRLAVAENVSRCAKINRASFMLCGYHFPSIRGSAALEGQRVLIVEDCYLMADALQDILTAAGATVVGAANSVGTALRMLEAVQIDMAC